MHGMPKNDGPASGQATSSDPPVLLRLKSGGHLAGPLDQVIDQTTDWYTFLFHQAGLGYRPTAPA